MDGREARILVFNHYGLFCVCCGTTENLTIDHTNGDGKKHRAETKCRTGWTFYLWLVKHGFPIGFQSMCLSCNSAKGARSRCPIHHNDRMELGDRVYKEFIRQGRYAERNLFNRWLWSIYLRDPDILRSSINIRRIELGDRAFHAIMFQNNVARFKIPVKNYYR